jgi:hypothetical protein
MRIHTLGPEGTDCYTVANQLLELSKGEIIGYASFDDIIDNIENFINEYILFPVAFVNKERNYDWKDFNFEYWSRLELVNLFHQKTKPMYLIENEKWKEDLAVIQPATNIFMEQYLKANKSDTKILFENSKFSSLEHLIINNYRYTIISDDIYESRKNNFMKIKKIYEPSMIWCLYKICRSKKNDI